MTADRDALHQNADLLAAVRAAHDDAVRVIERWNAALAAGRSSTL
jgi:hypothetical protein